MRRFTSIRKSFHSLERSLENGGRRAACSRQPPSDRFAARRSFDEVTIALLRTRSRISLDGSASPPSEIFTLVGSTNIFGVTLNPRTDRGGFLRNGE